MVGTIEGNKYDLNGGDLILDADGDTFIRASTDDQVEVHIGGAEKLRYTAGAFAFQEATAISTTAGDLTLRPVGSVIVAKASGIPVINLNHTGEVSAKSHLVFVNDSVDQMGIIYDSYETGAQRLSVWDLVTGPSELFYITPTAIAATKIVDVSSIGAGNPLFKVVATTDVPTAAWNTDEGYEVTTAPTGWIEMLVGATSVYVPYWV